MLGKIAGLLGLLGAGLYFTGWVYRSTYFDYFQLEVNTLNLPYESFLIESIQVFLGNLYKGDFSTILRNIWIAITIFIIVKIIFIIIEFAIQESTKILNNLRLKLLRLSLKTKYYKKFIPFQSFLYYKQFNYQNYDKALINEIVVILWLLITLYFLGQTQGNLDAIRDSRNDTSLLPIVTVIIPENRPLGRKRFDLTDDPNNVRIIGDIELYERLLKLDYNNKTDSNFPQVIWRLLIDIDSQYYIFPSLSQDEASNARPPVVVIQQSDRGEYTVILSPQAPTLK
ncbi:MAG: hypothetical protein F6K40_39100 [Okeania sp. SIO3I5]|uniref:hypothetical protein n=1 Tax=Okeania sp. SIO3I5 TaxID=2607805 RepID=UPI0013B7B982|nr:hypothetical protein [Okeania sp. SIO3I5]NEQ41870.1 hypothetical protein [Okeania sp. SIO3I5]